MHKSAQGTHLEFLLREDGCRWWGMIHIFLIRDEVFHPLLVVAALLIRIVLWWYPTSKKSLQMQRVIWTCKLNKCTFYCCILNGVINCGGTVLSMFKLFTSAPEDVFCRSLAVNCIRLIEILLCALLLISTANYKSSCKEHFLISNFKDLKINYFLHSSRIGQAPLQHGQRTKPGASMLFTMHSVKMFSWDTFIVQSDHFSHIQIKGVFSRKEKLKLCNL